MANQCLGQIQACAIRVTRLEEDGSPDVGANNGYISDALVTLNVEFEIEEGNEITQKNACGAIKVNYKSPDVLKRITVSSLQLAVPDPELSELLIGGQVLTNGGGVGFAYPRLGEPISQNGVAIELWAKQVDEDGDQPADFPYAWWLLPRVKLRPGGKAFEDAAQLTNFAGFGIENSEWRDGPDGDWPDDSSAAIQWVPTDDIPDAQCGYVAVAAS